MVRTPVVLALISASALVAAPAAGADDLGYLINVAAGPGYSFANADQALAYGHVICDKIAARISYAQMVGDARSDLGNLDEYQASYLIGQAADQLCPELIWQLRQSAAGYRPAP